MDPIEVKMPSYPMLAFLSKYGRPLVAAVGAALTLAGIIAALMRDPPMSPLALVVTGLAIFLVGRIVVELVQLITDTLLPK